MSRPETITSEYVRGFKAGESSALERAAQEAEALSSNYDKERAEIADGIADAIRALASPAAAPAAETCSRCGGDIDHGRGCSDIAPPSEPVAPADLRDERIAELEALLRKLIAWAGSTPVNAVTMSAWIHGVKFEPEDVAVWDEARAAIADGGEGKT